MKYLVALTIVTFIVSAGYIANHNMKPVYVTQYQKCLATSTHMRSTTDRENFVHGVCERLPVETADVN